MWLIPDSTIIEKEFNELYNEIKNFFDKRVTKYNTHIIPVNIYENDEGEIKIIIPAPGISKDKIDIEYKNSQLSINLEKTKDINDKIIYRREERVEGKLDRVIEIEEVDPDTIKAQYEDGILTLTMKRKEGTFKKIAIE